jgi:hypothetical protein
VPRRVQTRIGGIIQFAAENYLDWMRSFAARSRTAISTAKRCRPDGHCWYFAEHVRDVSAEEMKASAKRKSAVRAFAKSRADTKSAT